MLCPARLGVLQTVGAQAARPVAAQPDVINIRHPELHLVLLGGRLRIDPPPLGQVLADQDDADGSPDVGDAIAQRDHRRHRFGCGSRGDLEGALGHGHLGRADGRGHGLGAGENPAHCTRRQIEPPAAEHGQAQTQAGTDHREDGEGQAVFFQAVEKGGADAQSDPVHEQVVHQRFGEIVQLHLDPVGRGPGRQGDPHHDCRGHHAEAVPLDRESSDPDREAYGEKKEQKRVRRQIFEKDFHVEPPFCSGSAVASPPPPRGEGGGPENTI